MSERESMVGALKDLVSFLDAHPEVPAPYIGHMVCSLDKEQVPVVARALGSFKKEYQDSQFNMVKHFGDESFGGGFKMLYFTARENVCERVVVGTREVPEQEVQAREACVIPAHTEEIVEWVCSEKALLEPGTDIAERVK